MKKFVLPILFVIFLSQITANAQTEKEVILQKCEMLIGKMIDKEQNLFEVNELFVLQPEFDGENLIKLRVVPKYLFEENHSEWAEPDDTPQIPRDKFRELVGKLRTLKSIGNSLKKWISPAVTNFTLWNYELYEQGFLEYGLYWDWRETHLEDLGIRWLRIYFPQTVHGKVIQKAKSKSSDSLMVVTDSNEDGISNRYYVSQKTFDSLKKSKTQTFQGIWGGQEVIILKSFKSFKLKIKPFPAKLKEKAKLKVNQ